MFWQYLYIMSVRQSGRTKAFYWQPVTDSTLSNFLSPLRNIRCIMDIQFDAASIWTCSMGCYFINNLWAGMVRYGSSNVYAIYAQTPVLRFVVHLLCNLLTTALAWKVMQSASSVRPSSCPSVYTLVWTDWHLTLIFCMLVGLDQSSPWIEGQGRDQRSKCGRWNLALGQF